MRTIGALGEFRTRSAALAAAVVTLAASFLAVVATPAHAGVVINVPASQPTIQAGIDAASSGDTVVVAPGTYFEHIDFKGKAIEVRSSAGARSTILDGGGTSVVVTFKSGEGRSSVLRGFTITHGLDDGGTGVLYGAGVGIDNSSPTITENIVTENDADGHVGGGIGVLGGAPLIYDNYIVANRGGDTGGGGGVGLVNSAAEVEMNVVERNTAAGGGGVLALGGSPVVRRNFIRENSAGAFGGGGLLIDGSGPGGVFVNLVILGNTSQGAGGGVRVQGSSPAYLLNDTIVNNHAPSGTGLHVEAGFVTVANTIVFGPTGQSLVRCASGPGGGPLFSHNVVYNGAPSPYEGCADPTGTLGNIAADPLVDAPDSLGYYPRAGSPAIDAGDNDATSLPAVDDLGNPRAVDGNGDGVAVVDMGAVERPPVAVTGARYHPLTPARVLDTRSGLGAPAAKVGSGAILALQVTGRGGVPASGVSAVVLNLTVTQPAADGYLTAWPAGATRPTVSNLNFVAGRTVPNLVTVQVGAGGQVNLYNAGGATHVIADIAGWYGGPSRGSRYFGVTPARILDTRTGNGAPAAALGSPSTLALQVTGRGGVPATGVAAVVLNVTVTQPTSDGYLTAWPAGVARPAVSNLNFVAGQTVPNLVVVKVGDGGKVNLYNSGAPTHVIADVAGWYGADGGRGGAGFTGGTPARILDTRSGLGAPAAKVGPGATLALKVTGAGNIPASGAKSVVLNVTVTQPTASSYLTVWPAGVSRPLSSNLNYVAGQTVANLVVVDVDEGGTVNLYNFGGSTHIVADVAGWFA